MGGVSILRVDGEKVVDASGNPIILRGAAIGGWMNMENFIIGYPGHESQFRASMQKVLGAEKYEYFFDKLLTYYFTEKDAEFFASLGLNCLRLPFNYRHFEDDMNPRVLKKEGFKHLDRVVDLCAQHGIYTVLDLHAVPGGQNPDWHSDNVTSHAAFWDHQDFQDRAVWLWEQVAAHYKGNPWVAGYNPLNEPADSEHTRLVSFYDRVEKAIRAVDPNHILWLDGNTFAMDFTAFDHVLPNCVYSLHDYSIMGFPTGERYKGTPEQNTKIEHQYLRKSKFMTTHKVPIWNGEFGPVYEQDGEEKDNINAERYNLLGQQLRVYDKYGISWSIWTYKDIGLQGMIYTSPSSKWRTHLAPFLAKKKDNQVDAWGHSPSAEVAALLQPVADWIDRVSPDAPKTYPDPWNTRRHLSRAVKELFLAGTLSMEFAEYFRGMGESELDQMARSFSFEECVQREGLNDILRAHASGRGA